MGLGGKIKMLDFASQKILEFSATIHLYMYMSYSNDGIKVTDWPRQSKTSFDNDVMVTLSMSHKNQNDFSHKTYTCKYRIAFKLTAKNIHDTVYGCTSYHWK